LSDFFEYSLKPSWQLTEQLLELEGYKQNWLARAPVEENSLKYQLPGLDEESALASLSTEGISATEKEISAEEIKGYVEALGRIRKEDWSALTEEGICDLHNAVFVNAGKDAWHRGTYKKHSNLSEAKWKGDKYIVYQVTAASGVALQRKCLR
jgi:hypothetical protein